MTVTDPFAATSAGPMSTDPFNAGGDPFGAPAPRITNRVNIESLKGRLLLFTPKNIKAVSKTIQEGQNTKTVEVDRCTADVAVLDGEFPIKHIDGITKEFTGRTFDERVYPDMWIDPVGLVNAMRKAVARQAPPMVLGRLGRVPNPKGLSPIWVLQDPTPADIATARAYLAKTVDPFA